MSEADKIALEAFEFLPGGLKALTAQMEAAGMSEDARQLAALLLDLQEWALQAAYEEVNPERGKELITKARELLTRV